MESTLGNARPGHEADIAIIQPLICGTVLGLGGSERAGRRIRPQNLNDTRENLDGRDQNGILRHVVPIAPVIED